MTNPAPERPGIRVLEFQDVLVSPYDAVPGNPPGPLTRGGPHWPDWQNQREARQCRRGVPIDAAPLPARPEGEIAEPLMWGGPVVSHFGHQIAEFSMRLVPSVVAQPDRAIAFSSHPDFGFRRFDDLPRFVRDTFAWVGLPAERTRLITRPTLIRELAVCPQAEQLNGPEASATHLDLMDAFVEAHLGHTAPRVAGLYVSRAGQRTPLAGEGYLEHLMTAAGFSVIRPEDVPLATQLLAYANADQLIFSEGSAMHGVRLLGRNLRDVLVLRRQPGPVIAGDAVDPRALSLTQVDAIHGRLFSILSDGRPAYTPAVAILDATRLRDRLVELVPRLERHWDTRAFEASRDEALLAWIGWWLERSMRQATIDRAATWASWHETLHGCGLVEVARSAEELARRAEMPARRSAWSRLRRWRATRRAEPALRALISGSGYFDETWYLDRYPDVDASGFDAITHFLRIGADEGRHPGPDFDLRAYRAQNADVAASGANPLVHYLRHGAAEGRVIHRTLDADRSE